MPPILSSCGLAGADVAGPPSSLQGGEGEGFWIAASRGGREAGREPSQPLES